jgi:large subunit ribosomal protein L6
MSRVGSSPIPIPKGVQVIIKDQEIKVKGPKGELVRVLHPDVSAAVKDNVLEIRRASDEDAVKALHGLYRSLVANMVQGVTTGFQKDLEIMGVGYRAQKTGDKIVLQIGFSHPVEFVPPPGITASLDGTTKIKLSGIDKEQLGQVAANLRGIYPPDKYKGKGIKYADERLRLKPGKAGKATTAKK